MHLSEFERQFVKRSQQRGLAYVIGTGASDEDIKKAEDRLAVEFPAQVRLYYQCADGLRIEEPRLEILPIAKINRVRIDRLHFATLDSIHQLYFAVPHLNEAGQWDIVSDSGYRVTFTMASFWSNKIWAWLDKRREIWQEESAKSAN